MIKKFSTRATKYLSQNKILFEVVEYEHEEKGAEFAAQAIGFPLEQTIKTLAMDLAGHEFAFALMPGHLQLDLKLVAKAFSVKRALMADTAAAERLTGYLVGGISPFGSKRSLPSIMEKKLLKYDKVAINAGQRGRLLIMNPKDIVSLLNCKLTEIARI